MSKHRSKRSTPSRPSNIGAPATPEQQGLRAFRAGRLTEAIQLWERQRTRNPALASPLAEAYFQRALAPKTDLERQLADLQSAVRLVPDDPRYQYHLALALHRRGDPAAALSSYHAALRLDPTRRGAALAAALARLEVAPNDDLSDVPGLSDADRAALTRVGDLLHAEPHSPPADGPSPLASLFPNHQRHLSALESIWLGLSLITAGDMAAARAALEAAADVRLPAPIRAVRSYYLGVVAAQTGEIEVALAHMGQARKTGMDTPWLKDNLRILHIAHATSRAQADDWPAATASALAGLEAAPGNAPLTEIAVVGLDHDAQAAALRGDWETAASRWAQARDLASNATIGSARPLLHNLALAYEQLERWEDAAETWRAMLRTRPRRTTGKRDAEPEFPSPEQWSWVRKRVILAYEHAGRPDQAIVVFRQAIKADPTDIDARLQLVDALLANNQDEAADNELHRIIQLDPTNLEARLRLAEFHIERQAWYAAHLELEAVQSASPKDRDVRERLVRGFIECGHGCHALGWHEQARVSLTQALAIAPDNYAVHTSLGRLELDAARNHPEQRAAAIQHFDRALALAPTTLDAYSVVFRAWVIEHDLAAARAVLARAEASVPLTVGFLIQAGLDCLRLTVPMRIPNLFGPPELPGPPPEDWRLLGVALLDRALGMVPADPEPYRTVVSNLFATSPATALPYAERLSALTPDDPLALMLLGITQAATSQTPAAKETLRRAAQLARRQHNYELEQQIQIFRREINNPMLPVLLSLGPALNAFDDDDWEE